jgi:hypothetical protein
LKSGSSTFDGISSIEGGGAPSISSARPSQISAPNLLTTPDKS